VKGKGMWVDGEEDGWRGKGHSNVDAAAVMS